MKAAIFNPYLDTLGGGERYTMAVATTLLRLGYSVDVEWREKNIKKKLEDRFGINLDGVSFVDDIKRGDGYDICFWVSDGSIPILKSRKNFLHFQVPFHGVGGKSLINKFKLYRINKVIVNSNFTKKIIDDEFGIDSVVLYPPVGTDEFRQRKKENIILNVARFSTLLQSKRQDVLIKTFKNFSVSNPKYKLILAGGVEIGADVYIKKIENEAVGSKIEILKSPDHKTLKKLYEKAKIFWSASGYGVDEKKEPEKVEHFGITVVESMAAGCVPIVTCAGGHKEIIKNTKNGFLWENEGDLFRYTKKIAQDEKTRNQIAAKAKLSSQKFSYKNFEENFAKLCAQKM